VNSTLTWIDFAAISPFLILIIGALLLLLLESFTSAASRKYSLFVTLVTLGVAIFAAFYTSRSENPLLTSWIRFDAVAHLFNLFFLSIGIAAALLTEPFFQRFEESFEVSRGEYFFLLLSSLFGLLLIASAADFLILFLGIETLSISLYILCAYIKKWEPSSESALKYFLMGSIAAAFLLYGVALIYGAIGTTRFDALMPSYQALTTHFEKTLFFGGIAFVTLGLAFEAALVPFHLWAPDVYDGAPTPVTALMAVGTKAGAFAALAILFFGALPHFYPLWNTSVALLAYPTLIYANIVAIRQVQIRRFFAYSGIAHAGFLLIPLAVGTPAAFPALIFYLVIYVIATLGAFAVISCIDERSQGVFLYDLRGLFKRNPALAAILTLCLLTLGGIPPTAGFFAKFYLFKLAFEAGYVGLVIVGLLTTILSAFYYVRIIAVMFADAPENTASHIPFFWSATLVGLFSTVTLIALSCYPKIICLR
jgi:NADH-quinone oxidoreductase subunit N